MKLLFILLTSLITLASCADKYTVQRVSDGAILKVKDFEKRDFETGDTVYITEVDSYSDDWQISTNTWIDTFYCYSGSEYTFCWSYSAAIIK
jgi:hypothetical protein